MFLPSLNKVTCLDFTKSHVISHSKEAQFKVQFTNYQYELTKRVNEKAFLVSFPAIYGTIHKVPATSIWAGVTSSTMSHSKKMIIFVLGKLSTL